MGAEVKLDLFLDESGLFAETSTNSREKAESRTGEQFPSLLAGILAPRGQVTEQVATKILKSVCGKAKIPFSDEVHFKKIREQLRNERENGQRKYSEDEIRELYSGAIIELARQIRLRGWQPVRIVNEEQVTYGDRIANYTSIVAELILRICRAKLKEGVPRVAIHVTGGKVYLSGERDGPIIQSPEYEKRIQQALTFVAVRRGFAANASRWTVENVTLRSGTFRPELQLADGLAHASHADYRGCTVEAERALRDAFGAYDFNLVLRDFQHDVEQHVDEGSFGLALRLVAELFVSAGGEDDVEQGVKACLGDVLDRLAEMDAPARDSHLSLLVFWLEQLLELQRSLSLGYRVAEWLRERVDKALRTRLGEGRARSMDWFSYALALWSLTWCNHRGELARGRIEADRLRALAPNLAGRWEHAPLLIEGFIAEAVHRIDCYDMDQASARMRFVSSYYEGLAELFPRALPGIITSPVRSDLRGKALGTWLQSEIKAGLADAARLARARAISDQAIEEFSDPANRARQYQYRCHLETAANEFEAARENLALSLGADGSTHAALAEAIHRLADKPVAQGFAFLHWTRLGAACALAPAPGETESFFSAFDSSGLATSPWCLGKMADYPAHGILRRIALLRAARRSDLDAHRALLQLERIRKAGVLDFVLLAAYAEVAALLWDRSPEESRRLVDCQADAPLCIKRILRDVQENKGGAFETLRRMAQGWAPIVDRLTGEIDPAEARRELLRLARPIAD
jgi:hypothetical protein